MFVVLSTLEFGAILSILEEFEHNLFGFDEFALLHSDVLAYLVILDDPFVAAHLLGFISWLAFLVTMIVLVVVRVFARNFDLLVLAFLCKYLPGYIVALFDFLVLAHFVSDRDAGFNLLHFVTTWLELVAAFSFFEETHRWTFAGLCVGAATMIGRRMGLIVCSSRGMRGGRSHIHVGKIRQLGRNRRFEERFVERCGSEFNRFSSWDRNRSYERGHARLWRVEGFKAGFDCEGSSSSS